MLKLFLRKRKRHIFKDGEVRSSTLVNAPLHVPNRNGFVY
jgi:hypothetical protein